MGVETRGGGGTPWTFNAVLDNVVSAILLGLVVNVLRDYASMLRVRLAGVAPNVGEYRFAFPSDCLPLSTCQGDFAINADRARIACRGLARGSRGNVREVGVRMEVFWQGVCAGRPLGPRPLGPR